MKKTCGFFSACGKKGVFLPLFAYAAMLFFTAAVCISVSGTISYLPCGELLCGTLPLETDFSHYGVFPLISLDGSTAADTASPQKQRNAKTAKVEKAPVAEPVTVQKTSIAAVSSADLPSINSSANYTPSKSDYTKPVSFSLTDSAVLILHTHATESYTPSGKYPYTPTDTDRTTDNRFNVVRVGEEVAAVLRKNGITVYHDKSQNDYPGYNKSYSRSCAAATAWLKKDSSVKIILDIHRDALQTSDGKKLARTSEINGERVAQIMLVAGSNLSGLKHDSWRDNLSFAYALQKHTQELYPTLFRPINFRSQRFNQHLAPAAIIAEVGSNGNTLDEALAGARLFAEGLCSFILSA